MHLVKARAPKWILLTLLIGLPFKPPHANADSAIPCLRGTAAGNAIVVADSDGRVIYQENENQKNIPASTLKILTALAAIRHFGPTYRFPTEFYLDADRNLMVKGYGDPLLVSEVWQEIADHLAGELRDFKDLIVDDTYFSNHIRIPGRKHSTNPYDAPVGALCANFNTISFAHDRNGRIISSEPQTPLLPFALEKIRALRLREGRYTFSHERQEAARYAAELLLFFLKKRGVHANGKIRFKAVGPQDRLILSYESSFTLEALIRKMLEFSNNFMANQIFIALGAHILGPPGTLKKGVGVVSAFAEKELQLKGLQVVEGSGISRDNRLSALEMLSILKGFKPYCHLLRRDGPILYKTGTLKGIRTRAGYIEAASGELTYFVFFQNGQGGNMDGLVSCLERFITER